MIGPETQTAWAAALDAVALLVLISTQRIEQQIEKGELVPVPGPRPLVPCAACNGHGSDDGLPCGTYARDFGPGAPGPCVVCDGEGEVSNG